MTYIYKLHDNVFFHDKPPVNGRQLTADDMAANYERLFGIGRFAGQEPAPHTWGTKSIPVESVTATDKLTFVIKLSKPFAAHSDATGRGKSLRAHCAVLVARLHV